MSVLGAAPDPEIKPPIGGAQPRRAACAVYAVAWCSVSCLDQATRLSGAAPGPRLRYSTKEDRAITSSTWSGANPEAHNMKIADIAHQVTAMYEHEVAIFNESKLTKLERRAAIPEPYTCMHCVVYRER